MSGFRVLIERQDRWGPFAYYLWITPAPRFGGRGRFASTRRRAEAKARRWIARAEADGRRDEVIVIEADL